MAYARDLKSLGFTAMRVRVPLPAPFIFCAFCAFSWRFPMLDAEYLCAYCGQPNPTSVDPSAGRRQSYVEDCQTCCRPNLLRIEITTDRTPTAIIEAEPESGAAS